MEKFRRTARLVATANAFSDRGGSELIDPSYDNTEPEPIDTSLPPEQSSQFLQSRTNHGLHHPNQPWSPSQSTVAPMSGYSSDQNSVRSYGPPPVSQHNSSQQMQSLSPVQYNSQSRFHEDVHAGGFQRVFSPQSQPQCAQPSYPNTQLPAPQSHYDTFQQQRTPIHGSESTNLGTAEFHHGNQYSSYGSYHHQAHVDGGQQYNPFQRLSSPPPPRMDSRQATAYDYRQHQAEPVPLRTQTLPPQPMPHQCGDHWDS